MCMRTCRRDKLVVVRNRRVVDKRVRNHCVCFKSLTTIDSRRDEPLKITGTKSQVSGWSVDWCEVESPKNKITDRKDEVS